MRSVQVVSCTRSHGAGLLRPGADVFGMADGSERGTVRSRKIFYQGELSRNVYPLPAAIRCSGVDVRPTAISYSEQRRPQCLTMQSRQQDASHPTEGNALSHMGMTRLRRVVNARRAVLPSCLICSLISLGTCKCGRLHVRDGGVTAPICLLSGLSVGLPETSY